MAATLLAVVPLASLLAYVTAKGLGGLSLDLFTELPKPVGEAGGGVRVATTSDVYGANLLASGRDAGGSTTLVRKYELVASASSVATLDAELLSEVEVSAGEEVPNLGGD